MVKKIKYIRMSTGDEIISDVFDRGKSVVFKNPMEIEYMEMTTGADHPFLTRYNPYSAEFSISVDKDQIIFMGDTTPEMIAYYETTLKYIEGSCDKLVSDRVIEAEQYIAKADDDDSEPHEVASTVLANESQEESPYVFPLGMTFH